MTKPITAAATLALVEEGLISLDEPVDHLLPELASPRVLARMDGPLDDAVAAARASPPGSATFTFGSAWRRDVHGGHFLAVVTAANRLRLATLGPPDPAGQPDPDTWIAGLGSLPLLAQPGERWLYNTGASVLGVLLARAAGQPFGEVLRSRIFEPLGMPTPPSGPPTPTASPPPTDDPRRSCGLGRARRRLEPPTRVRRRRRGLLSTVDDLLVRPHAAWVGGAGAVRRRGPRDDDRPADLSQEARHTEGWAPTSSKGARGVFRQAVYDDGSFGWDGGLGSSWLTDPAHEATTIVLTQRQFDTHVPPPLHGELQAAARAALA